MSEESPTWEEATRCPRCGRSGEDTGARPGKRRGVMIHTIYCRTELCTWHNTSWLVQINEDGTIPQAHSRNREKQFPTVSPETETRINEALQRQLDAETSGHGEVRNPYA